MSRCVRVHSMRALAFLLNLLILMGMLLPAMTAGAEPEQTEEGQEQTDADQHSWDIDTYADVDAYFYYAQKYAQAGHPEETVTLDLLRYAISSGSEKAAEPYADRQESASGLVLVQESGIVSWQIDVPASGLYYVQTTYYALEESDYPIEMGLLIDGTFPYAEARSCTLSRIYVNSEIKQDEKGNDIRPQASQRCQWQTRFMREKTGTVGEVCVYLEKGTHLFSLEVDENIPFLVDSIELTQKPYILTYQDYLSYHKQKGASYTEEILKVFPAETYSSQSSSALWPTSDKSSPLVEPFDYLHDKLNTGGGSQWTSPGDWISWDFEVPEDGFYQLAFKYRQGYLDGLFSSRAIYIDGEMPFQELSSVQFNYTNEWETLTLGDGDQAYSIYLKAGPHTLTMENTLGSLSQTIATLETVSSLLNDQYLEVVMITGAEPDVYRDYYLDKTLPDLANQLKKAVQILQDEVDRLIEVVGKRGEETSYMEDVIYDLTSIAENVDSLTYNSRLSDLKNIISGLAEKMIELEEQALDLDCFMVYSKGRELPSTKMNFWQQIKFQVMLFITSFTKSYQNAGETASGENSIDVWLISGGSEQYMLLNTLIRESFYQQSDTHVNLRLVTNSLIQAVVSGIGPDVVIGTDADTIVNLALRGALEPLNNRPGVKELEAEYIPGCFTPFTLENHLYGIPLTNDFGVMFVRTDIFRSLGLEIPKTWDDVINISQVLERRNMSLGCVPAFASLVYQNGGQYFDDGRTKVLFDDEIAIDALETMGEYYTIYGFPISFDFVSRFRTGEMPIAIANYSSYVTLEYSAPEISGLWEMYTTPGTVQEDGSVNYLWADSGGTGISLMSGSSDQEKDAGWEFIKWFCGYEVQAQYGNDLEASLGVSGRYSTANKLALDKLNWTAAEKKTLFSQIEQMVYIPIVPGNYYVTRGLSNATRAVIYEGVSARETLREWSEKINSEITRKRNEFSLNN